MTVHIGIEPELEARLAARARQTGQSLEELIREILKREAAATDSSASSIRAGQDKAKAFRAWAESFPSDLPVLTLENVSREAIYRRD
jgi:ribosomal protein L12E/L44/L45/RPP1/RPP2